MEEEKSFKVLKNKTWDLQIQYIPQIYVFKFL